MNYTLQSLDPYYEQRPCVACVAGTCQTHCLHRSQLGQEKAAAVATPLTATGMAPVLIVGALVAAAVWYMGGRRRGHRKKRR